MPGKYTKNMGNKGEDLACEYLKRQGYKILERNFRSKLGEIDIIAKEKDTLVFVEVKYRNLPDQEHPKAAVDQRKQGRLSKVALTYLKAKSLLEYRARFDVVAISQMGPKAEIELIRNAFEPRLE